MNPHSGSRTEGVFENASTVPGRPDEPQRPRQHAREGGWSSAIAVDGRAFEKLVDVY